MNIEIIVLNLLISTICLLSSLYIYFTQNYSGYELLFTQPLIYLLIFNLVFSKIIVKDKTRLFFLVLSIITGIRYVILPSLLVLTNYYGGRSIVEPESTSFYHAILLMNYELIIVGIIIIFMENSRERNKFQIQQFRNNQFFLTNQNWGYILFFLFTILIVLLYPSSLNSINFISPSSLLQELEYSTVENIAIYCVTVSKQLLFLILVKKMFLLYKINKSKIFIFFSFIFAMLNIFIYFGTNRSDIIISAVVSFLILYRLFGKITIKYFLLGSVVIISLISMVTNSRNHISISKGQSFLIDITDTFQVYTGGIYNVAIALETKTYFPKSSDWSVLFFDIFRPMIGINIFIKNLPFEYSNIFYNRRMWLHVDRRSQIIPMIGQGNLHFGYILAPILSIIIIRLYYYLEKKIISTSNLEIYYFLSLVVVRLGFFMGQNTMNIINDMSMNLVLFIFVFHFNNIINTYLLKTR